MSSTSIECYWSNGDIQGVGTPPVITVLGANFTVTRAVLIIDQLS